MKIRTLLVLTLLHACTARSFDDGGGEASSVASSGSNGNSDDGTSNAATAVDAETTGESAGPPPPRLVFVTSVDVPGNWAEPNPDRLCNHLADQAGLIRRYPNEHAPAGIHKQDRFRAWASVSSMSAADRLYHADVSYVRLDGVVVADGWTELTSTSPWAGPAGPFLRADITVAEDLSERHVPVWTGANPDGSRGRRNCAGFTLVDAFTSGTTGLSNRGDGGWTDIGDSDCSLERAIYCVETYRGEVADPRWQCLEGRGGEACKPSEYEEYP